MRLRCTTEAWLHRLAIRENSAASVTHRFGTHDHMSCDDRGAQRPGLRCRQYQPASRATVPGAPATGQRAKARHSMDVRQQLRGRGYASSEVDHEALVEGG